MNITQLVNLMKNPSDLPAAAKAVGMDYTAIDATNREVLQAAFVRLATAAQLDGAEVMEMHGVPTLLKGKRVRVIAVLEEVPEALKA